MKAEASFHDDNGSSVIVSFDGATFEIHLSGADGTQSATISDPDLIAEIDAVLHAHPGGHRR